MQHQKDSVAPVPTLEPFVDLTRNASRRLLRHSRFLTDCFDIQFHGNVDAIGRAIGLPGGEIKRLSGTLDIGLNTSSIDLDGF